MSGLDTTAVAATCLEFKSPTEYQTKWNLSFDHHPLLPVIDSPSPHTSVPLSARHNVTGLPAKPNVVRPQKSQLHQLFRTSPELRTIVKEKVAELIVRVAPIVSAVKDDASCLSVRIPEQAVFRLEQAYLWNRLHNSEAGHRLVLAGLKRATLELHAFILWHRDQSIFTNSNGQPPSDAFTKDYRTRGIYVNTVTDYDRFGRFGVAVLLDVDLHQVTLPSHAQHVDLSPIPVERNVLFPEGYAGGHHCYLHFYPPIIEDSRRFELAARGYQSRSDVYHSNRAIDKLFDNMSKDFCEYTFRYRIQIVNCHSGSGC